MADPTIEDRMRFGKKVQVDLETGCHLWVGGKTPGGYGIFNWNGKRVLAHRVAWQWVWGPIPAGKLICHTCDVPECVNVNHLFSCTHKENMQDASRKGRTATKAKGNYGGGRTRLRTPRRQAILDDYNDWSISVAEICIKHNCSRQGVLSLAKSYNLRIRPVGRMPKKYK